MSKLINCPSCGKPKSSTDGAVCPHCRHGANTHVPVPGQCRVCQKPLVVQEHLYKQWVGGGPSIAGNKIFQSGGHWRVERIPCPYCGEPRPILREQDKSAYLIRRLILGATMAVLLALAGLYKIVPTWQCLVLFFVSVVALRVRYRRWQANTDDLLSRRENVERASTKNLPASN